MVSDTAKSTHEIVETAFQHNKKSREKRLREFITEALQIDRERRAAFNQRFPGVPQIWPAWPYLDYGTVPSAISNELGSPEKTVREMRWRLKQFQYPYAGRRAKKQKTFYQHAKSIGILDDLLKPPLLWDIRAFWWFQRDRVYHQQLIRQKKSEYGYPLALHQGLLSQLSAHIDGMENLVKKYEATETKDRKAWRKRFDEYRRASLKQLLSEAAIIYPQVQGELILATQMNLKAEKLKAEISLFQKFNAAIKQKGGESHKFAYHLTSLICTSRDSIVRHQLRPAPDSVRRDVEVWIKSHPI